MPKKIDGTQVEPIIVRTTYPRINCDEAPVSTSARFDQRCVRQSSFFPAVVQMLMLSVARRFMMKIHYSVAASVVALAMAGCANRRRIGKASDRIR
jgi:hypothetical protein